MIGNRIKLIRQAHALSLQDLSEQLAANADLSIHRSALSGYETGRTVPNATILKLLSQELGVPVDFFEQPDWTDFSLEYFYCPKVVPQRQQETDAYVQVKLERHRTLDQLLDYRSKWKRPEVQCLTTDQEDVVELLAKQLREEWNLGVFPIASVCGLLESIGWYLLVTPNNLNRVELNSTELCGYEQSSGMPFILYSSSYFPDEIRYKLLRFLGYAYLRGDTKEQTEALVSHFARAMLFSHEQVVAEVGLQRTSITERELDLLKQKYGMSKRCIMYRLYELGIISPAVYKSFTAYLHQNLFLKREGFMGQPFSFEVPTAYDLKLLRAHSEKLLTADSEAFSFYF